MSPIHFDPRAQGPRAPIASSGYDHDDRHFRFQRSHKGELEHTPPERGYGYDVIVLAGIAACVALGWAFAWVIS